ncbi:hypothetical protein IV203_022657 [Nitzschia inconspicua]|uniref:Uncharacterized protein n=1 Tax=Nitzschia inconspicua TaxID=303405 RepID=A0A9K3KKA8_9STRA|nr:hypothetical protein IV203_022654 [Nitzschia inconspicua]KAG7344649.1 hypothetical protein IV203_022657 [Nitzschia inconspicua]
MFSRCALFSCTCYTECWISEGRVQNVSICRDGLKTYWDDVILHEFIYCFELVLSTHVIIDDVLKCLIFDLLVVCNRINAWNLVILPFSTFTRLFPDINSQTWKPAQLFHRFSNIPRISSTTPLLPLCFCRRVQILSNIIDRIWSMQSNQLPVRAFSNMELADSDMFVVTIPNLGGSDGFSIHAVPSHCSLGIPSKYARPLGETCSIAAQHRLDSYPENVVDRL